LSRIYTRTGDTGETGLFGGGRVPKSDPRVAAYGDVDELNAAVGWAMTRIGDDALRSRLAAVQSDLFAIGGHLATPPGARSRGHLPDLPAGRPAEFEAWIDEIEGEVGALTSFILPGGSEAGAALHLARTVCRRAERAVVAVHGTEAVDERILIYLNRLSDLLFDLARLANRRAGVAERPWPGKG
jgi:cob(I)alamin adenosyltransferase